MMLAARDLSIGYGRHVIGSGIELTVDPGQVLCLLGPNGCGKTTLFKTLLGLIAALDGTVRLDDRPLERLSRAEIARAIGYVPQAHAPSFPFEAQEIVLMGRTARLGAFAQPSSADREAALAAMRRLGISDLAGHDYTRLSGGQRQLVLIARALAQEAPLIVMDEPTASLDFGNQAAVLSEIADLVHGEADGRRGIILSTHDPDQAFALDADVILMRDGQIHRAGRPEAVLTAETLSAVYGVAVSVERTESGRLTCVPPLRSQKTTGAQVAS